MAKFDKKWWFVHVPATFVVAGLIVFGVSKCNRLEDAEATRDSASNAASLATDKLNQAIAKMTVTDLRIPVCNSLIFMRILKILIGR